MAVLTHDPMDDAASISEKKKKAVFQNSTLILIGFATAFFPRLLSSFGAPSIINFIHFGIIPVICIATLLTTKTRDKKQILIVWEMIAGVSVLLVCMLISAVINEAGIVNLCLQFMFQAEPFMLMIAMISVSFSSEKLNKIRNWLLGFALFNLLLAIMQSILMPIGIYPRPKGGTLQDNITGVFGGGGGSAANYVSCTVSIFFALYFLTRFKHLPIWVRILPFLGALYQTQVSDSKQVFMALAMGWGLLALTKTKYPGKLIIYIIIGSIAIFSFSWALQNMESRFLAPYQNWVNRSIWGWDGLAAQTKFAAFRIVPSYYESVLNWLFGLGPGHTVTRLGGWVLRDYAGLLMPVGATIHSASLEVFDVARNTYLTQESTVYFPLFTWAGVWGDLGFVGLGAYIYLCSIVWRRVCVDDMTKFMMLSTASFGFILTQMEEPGHMLTVACLISLRWIEHRQETLSKQRAQILSSEEIFTSAS